MKYTIRRVSLTGLRAIRLLRRWLESWQGAEIGALGLTTTLDFVKLLRLEPTLRLLQTLDRQSWPLVLALVLVVSLVTGLLIGLSALLAGWGYNLLAWLTGGVEVELGEKAQST